MGRRPVRLHRDRHRTAMLKAGLACACVMLALVLIVAGCGGGSSAIDTTASTAAEQRTSTTKQAASMSGSELGDAAAALWAEAMQELVALLADKPEPAQVKAQVEQLKEDFIQELVELGRQGAELEPAEKAEMTSAMASGLAATDEDWYAGYSDIYSHYAGSDIEFSNLVADFNILTQYADFDLLKQQAPEEAARLGIE